MKRNDDNNNIQFYLEAKQDNERVLEIINRFRPLIHKLAQQHYQQDLCDFDEFLQEAYRIAYLLIINYDPQYNADKYNNENGYVYFGTYLQRMLSLRLLWFNQKRIRERQRLVYEEEYKDNTAHTYFVRQDDTLEALYARDILDNICQYVKEHYSEDWNIFEWIYLSGVPVSIVSYATNIDEHIIEDKMSDILQQIQRYLGEI